MKDDLIRKLASGISDRHIKKYADFAAEKDGIKVVAKTTQADNESASEGLRTPFLAAGEELVVEKPNKRGGSGVREKRSGGLATAWKAAASIAAVLVLIVAGILLGQYFRRRSDPAHIVPTVTFPETTTIPTMPRIDTDTPTPEVTPSMTEDPAPTAIVTPIINEIPTSTGTFTAAVTYIETSDPTSTVTPTATTGPTSTVTPTATTAPTATATPTATPDPTSTVIPTSTLEPTPALTSPPTDAPTLTATPIITDAPTTATPDQPTATPIHGDVPINESTFPDSEFREYIKKNYDLTKDSVLSDMEIKRVDSMNIYYNHKSIKGIEYFYELKSLYFNGVPSRSLDLSIVPNITFLYIGFASSSVAFTELLEELDISQNKKLEGIALYSNLITELDLSGNYELENIDLHITSLAKLDLSHNTNLKSCSLENMTLQELDLSKNDQLYTIDIFRCNVRNLILNENNSLNRINLINSGIEELDMKNNQTISELRYIGGNRLDISRCPNMRNAYLYGTSRPYEVFTDLIAPGYEYPDEANAGMFTLVTDCKNIYTG
ncbi:MAG: hypothetical protein IKH41_07055 [Clostridia bacterium]|nr:hypothetical protein [Clostridia bacterium]